MATIEELEAQVKKLENGLLIAHACIEELGIRLRNSEERTASVVIGDNTKGGPGTLKVYFNPEGSKEDNDKAVLEAKRVMAQCGGKPFEPMPFDVEAEMTRMGMKAPGPQEGTA